MDTRLFAGNVDYFLAHTISRESEIHVHLHDTYEIFQSLNGSLNYFVEGRIYTLEKNDVIITNVNEIHRPIIVSQDEPYDRRFVQFKPTAFIPFFNTDYNPLWIFDHREPGHNNLIQLAGNQDDIINRLLSEIEDFNHNPSPRKALIQKNRIIDLIIQLETRVSSESEAPISSITMDRRVKDIINYINKNFNQDLSLTLIAEDHYMDKFYLSHLFKSSTGFTVHEFIQSKRIKEAKRLIIEGLPLSQVCTACGYKDYSNFYKTFKKMTGLSPKDYR